MYTFSEDLSPEQELRVEQLLDEWYDKDNEFNEEIYEGENDE